MLFFLHFIPNPLPPPQVGILLGRLEGWLEGHESYQSALQSAENWLLQTSFLLMSRHNQTKDTVSGRQPLPGTGRTSGTFPTFAGSASSITVPGERGSGILPSTKELTKKTLEKHMVRPML